MLEHLRNTIREGKKMGLLSSLEKQAFSAIENKLEITTEFVEDDEGLFLVTTTFFDGVEVHSQETNLEPLIEAVKNRL
jgi:hypothetical protein